MTRWLNVVKPQNAPEGIGAKSIRVMMKGEMDTTQALNFALASAPTMLTVLIGIPINNARLSDLKADVSTRGGEINTRITDVNTRISDLRTHMDMRLDEMKDLWRSELHRLEEVLDARLKHLEERG